MYARFYTSLIDKHLAKTTSKENRKIVNKILHISKEKRGPFSWKI